ncbi:glycosyltransferase family 2 protein [Galbitalea soli]|uniref:Glycosyltransferase n=1 Tax=Galbitalea soli TaxID=1268042 RepID=A0A7C9PNW2_9MICO|nr:glycosyltransferase family 2 protein [Galbitalea soli]NEM91954.1 glycosyltransferase [Galbitalea soli]NYJ32098.1 cellulose synthase (UDP-forming) [Galbitalea soli]
MSGSAGGRSRILVLRIVVTLTLLVGLNYIVWRWGFSLNWNAWWIAIPLVIAETYSLIDVSLFGMTVWKSQPRPAPPPAPEGLGVDVFITTYNETVELVENTARAAIAIDYPHKTWILDDGNREEMRLAAEALGVGYITRSSDWKDRPRHAKAGNLNNALMETDGEFLLILDADQVPSPRILDATLGYFLDERVALVQTPQLFGNVATGDPLGSQAPLFYGPIQQGKDGWNAAFFCGSNAILRREALMQLGLMRYVSEVEQNVKDALSRADRVLATARRSDVAGSPLVAAALNDIGEALSSARARLAAGEYVGMVTYDLQQRVDAVAQQLVEIDLSALALDLAALQSGEEDASSDAARTPGDVRLLREISPLASLESVQELIRSIDVDRSDEAQPIMPLATISVTEDMATSMRLHAAGWKSVFHHEDLAIGLAPEDLRTMLGQRLRWAQGTMQVLIRENPLVQKGMTLAQRLMYFSTMWSYLSGFAAIAYFGAPIIFLCFGILPVHATAGEFFLRFLPFLVLDQLLFAIAGRGVSTWRGQQYSLALFPIWIKAVTSAAANVFFGRPLDFAVTSKTRQDSGPQWGLIKIQAAVVVALVIATIIGFTRLLFGVGEPVGTFVNLVWVVFDIVILSVLVPAARYRGYRPEHEETHEIDR